MDRINLNGLSFYGYHGLFPEENRLGQHFKVNVELYLPLQKAGETDEMKYSIDYGMVHDIVKEIVTGEPKNLIEAVAETIATEILNQFPTVHACVIEVVKPNPPIEGHYESVSVRIKRERK
ncbi:MAG TPA: dihydroneopterin aldolase [Pseudogracilibacillus sp.]|nr:dihydroneopterin aldolase [Pseudogracilibacillus sp.]HZW67597.1 dihydroneopterin aldolase [Pseudogracilibacillus sp.]